MFFHKSYATLLAKADAVFLIKAISFFFYSLHVLVEKNFMFQQDKLSDAYSVFKANCLLRQMLCSLPYSPYSVCRAQDESGELGDGVLSKLHRAGG